MRKSERPIKQEPAVARLKITCKSPRERPSRRSDIGGSRSHSNVRLDTFQSPDCKIGHSPNLQQQRLASLAPPSVASTSPPAGGGYQPAFHSQPAHSTPRAQQSRKRNGSTAELDSSPGSFESPEIEGTGDDQNNDGKRHPVKRACNECRQQKVSHTGKSAVLNDPLMRYLTATMRCQTRSSFPCLHPVQPAPAVMQDR